MAVGKCGGLTGQAANGWGSVALCQDNNSVGKEGWFIFAWDAQKCSEMPFSGQEMFWVYACQRTVLTDCQSKGGPDNVQMRHTAKNFPGHCPGKFRYFSTSASMSLTPWAPGCHWTRYLWFSYLTLLLVTVLAQALFPLVGSNFVSFTFFSARHTALKIYGPR